MLIKYYTLNQSLIIIDNIQDIHVPSEPSFGDYALEPWCVFDFDEDYDGLKRGNPKVITYAKDGPCVLKVHGTAYICNDDGKTIEKVSAL